MKPNVSAVGMVVCLCLLFIQVMAQKGKNGAVVITANTTSINFYSSLAADAPAGSTSITVTNNLNLSQGDLIFLIQMQGATIKNSPDKTWGEIVTYGNAGLNEFAEVAGGSGTTVNFSCGLKNAYSAAGKVQVIKVPRYASFTINNGDTLKSNVWNGATEGIVVMEVAGNVVINGAIDVSGMGFRGGDILSKNYQCAFPGTNVMASASAPDGAEKGESIAGYQADYDILFGGRYSQGAPANGGGGGSSHNAGGGGGANGGAIAAWTGKGNPDNSTLNYAAAWNAEALGFSSSTSSGGGRGGYSFAYFAPGETPLNPMVFGPGNPAYINTDNRRNVGGVGGRPLDYSTSRLFFGGGGGAGDANNNIPTNGGRGGGLIFIKTCGNISGSGSLLANGFNGYNAYVLFGNDGPGGAGGGGTVVLNAMGTISGTFTIQANGGKGGSQNMSNTLLEAEGPGGGGGGGVVLLSGGAITTSVGGGINGITNAPAVSPFWPNGATKGGSGTTGTIVKSTPILLSLKNRTICIGDTAKLNAGVVSGGAQNIIWYADSLGKKIRYSGASFTTPKLFADTVYYVGVSCGSDACSLAKLQPDSVFVRPIGVEAGRDTSFCSGGSTQIGVKAIPGYTYQWSPANGLNSTTISNPIAAPKNTGATPIIIPYIVQVKSPTCSSSDTVFITIKPIPKSIAGLDTTFCSGGKKILGTTATTGYTYAWSPAAGLSAANSANPTVTKFNTGTSDSTTKYIVRTSFNNCSSNDSVTITAHPIPNSEAGPDRSFCSGGSQSIGTAGSSVATATYSWFPSKGLSSSTTPNPTITLTNTSSDSISSPYILQTSAAGCSARDTVFVTVRPIPVAEAGSDTAYCSGGIAQIGTATTPRYTYSWNPTTGLNNASISNPTVKLFNTLGTPFYSKYIVTTSNNICSAMDTVSITVNPYPIAEAGPDKAFCSGDSAVLGTNSTNGYTYSWSPRTGLNTTSSANPSVLLYNKSKVPASNSYIVTAQSYGCATPDTVTVTVNPYPVAEAGRDTGICSGISVTIGGPADPSYTYSWSPPAAGISGSNPSLTLLNNGSSQTAYNYILKVLSFSCPSTDTVTIKVNPIPISNAGGPLPDYCMKAINVKIGTLSTPGYSYSWNPSNGLSSSSLSSPSINLSNTGITILTNTYTVTTSNAYNCKSSDKISINIFPQVIAHVGPPAELCKGESAQITASGGDYYKWNTGQTTASITVRPYKTSTYSAVVSSKVCVAMDSVTIKVRNENPLSIYIPNAFTPNDDGLNEIFKAYADPAELIQFKARIFNRWGELYFEWDDIKDGWNGTYHGPLVQEGVYVYTIETTQICESKKQSRVGTVTVVR